MSAKLPEFSEELRVLFRRFDLLKNDDERLSLYGEITAHPEYPKYIEVFFQLDRVDSDYHQIVAFGNWLQQMFEKRPHGSLVSDEGDCAKDSVVSVSDEGKGLDGRSEKTDFTLSERARSELDSQELKVPTAKDPVPPGNKIDTLEFPIADDEASADDSVEDFSSPPLKQEIVPPSIPQVQKVHVSDPTSQDHKIHVPPPLPEEQGDDDFSPITDLFDDDLVDDESNNERPEILPTREFASYNEKSSNGFVIQVGHADFCFDPDMIAALRLRLVPPEDKQSPSVFPLSLRLNWDCDDVGCSQVGSGIEVKPEESMCKQPLFVRPDEYGVVELVFGLSRAYRNGKSRMCLTVAVGDECASVFTLRECGMAMVGGIFEVQFDCLVDDEVYARESLLLTEARCAAIFAEQQSAEDLSKEQGAAALVGERNQGRVLVYSIALIGILLVVSMVFVEKFFDDYGKLHTSSNQAVLQQAVDDELALSTSVETTNEMDTFVVVSEDTVMVVEETAVEGTPEVLVESTENGSSVAFESADDLVDGAKDDLQESASFVSTSVASAVGFDSNDDVDGTTVSDDLVEHEDTVASDLLEHELSADETVVALNESEPEISAHRVASVPSSISDEEMLRVEDRVIARVQEKIAHDVTSVEKRLQVRVEEVEKAVSQDMGDDSPELETRVDALSDQLGVLQKEVEEFPRPVIVDEKAIAERVYQRVTRDLEGLRVEQQSSAPVVVAMPERERGQVKDQYAVGSRPFTPQALTVEKLRSIPKFSGYSDKHAQEYVDRHNRLFGL